MHNKSRLKHYHSKPIFEELEARQLFSAGVESLLAEQIPVPEATYADAAMPMSTAESQPEPVLTLDSKTAPYEIIIVDTSVEGYQTLIDDINNNASDGSNIEVIQLDDSKDGIAQITDILADRENLDAIHIISHGSDGSIDLGSSQLNFDTLIQNQQDISSWGNAFKEGGDILLYGCNVAETQFGQSFVDYLASITNTDIAASEDATGNSAAGGDWELEYQSGAIEAEEVLNSEAQTQWNDVLAVTANSTSSAQTSNLGLTSNKLTWSHTVNDGVNRALFVETVVSTTGTQVQSVTFGGVALTKIGSSSTNHPIEIWVLVNPTVSTANVVVTYGASGAAAAGATTYNGVNQSSAYSGFTKANGTGTTATVDVSSASGDLVMDAQYWANTSANVVGSNQTSKWSETITGTMKTGSTTEAGASTVTMTGTSTVSSDWEIAAVNIKAAPVATPVVTTTGTTLSYTENATIAVDSALTVTDSDSTNLASATITISSGFVSGQDTLNFTNQNGITGSWNSSTGVLTLTGSATVANYQTALRSITYTNASNAPNTATRTVSFVVNDGGLNSTAATRNISISAVNDPPVNGIPAAQTTNEDTNLVFSATNGNAISINDPDNSGASFEVTLSVTNGTLTLSGISNLTFNTGDGTADTTMTFRGTVASINTALNGLVYTPTANYNGSSILTLSTRDSTLVSLDIDANLQARYTFEGNANDVAPGTPQNGILYNGASIVTDTTHGQVLNLDGIDDHVKITGRFGNPANVTLAAWINLTSAGSSGAMVVSIGDSVSIVADSSGRLVGSYYAGGTWPPVQFTGTLAGTGWHHVAFVFNDTANVATLYLDGASVATLNTNDSISYTLGTDTYIGKHANGNANFNFGGKIDDARIYDRALTSSEIATIATEASLKDIDTVAITVAAVNDAPVLTPYSPTYNTVENAAAFSTSISTLLSSSVSDTDTGAVEGIAITSTNGSAGTVEYSINGGTNWISVGSVSNTNALLLRATDLLRFTPSNIDGGTVTVQYRAWDQTSGSAGTKVDTSSNGGTTAFSSATDTATVNVTSVNDAPSGADKTITTNEDTPYTFTVSDFGFSDTDGNTLLAVKITTLPGAGSLTLNGLAVTAGQSVSATNISSGLLKFTPSANANGAGYASFTFQVQDNGGTANGGADLDPTPNTITVNVTAVNDVPIDLYAINGIPESSLVAVYGFNNPSNLGRDDAGNNTPITFYGNPGQTTGPSGSGALDLAGGTSGQYGNISGITTGGAMTFAASVRFDSTGDWQRVFDFGQANSSGIGAIYVGRLGNTSDLTFTIEKDLGGGVWQVYRATASNAITNGNWMHFTATVDGSGNMALYVNGSVAATTVGVAPDVGVRTNNYIGKSNWGGDAAFDGAIDNFVIANGAMSTSQVAALYQQTTGFTITENAANGTVVGTVVGFDIDASANPTYSLTDSAGGRFAIGVDGALTVADGSKLDFETASSHTITVRVSDAAGATYDENFTIQLLNVNDAPVISGIEATTLAYTENGASTAITSSLVLADVDSANLSSATVRISGNYAAGQDVLAFTNQNGITGSWNASTGVLTLTGSASVANYQAALRSVTFVNTADNPSTAARTISITVNDGAVDSNSVMRTISVASVNDAPSFSVGTGRNYTVMSGMQFGNAVTQQADGKYILVGWSDGAGTRDFAVARYNTDGTLDTSFGGGNGYVITAIGSGADEAQDVKVLANGKILVAGYAENGFGYDVALVQYNADGTLDTSFGSGTGKALSGLAGSDDGYSFAVQSDGKILVAGSYSSNFMLMRFNSNGAVDTSFGASGVVNTDFSSNSDAARSMVVQPDGKILVAGQAYNSTTYTDFAVARYNSDGSLDTSFNGTGKVTVDLGTSSTDQGYGVALQSDGKILLTGFTNSAGTTDNALVRLNANGTLDTSFGGTGKVIVPIGSGSDFALDVKIQGDGKILTSGYTSGSSNDFSVVRYNSDGSLDTTFGGTGKVTTNFNATTDDRGTRLFLQGDGKIVLAGCTTQSGSYDLAIARYNSDGSLDTSFNPTSNTLGSTVSYTENAAGVVLDSDVQIFDSELSPSNFNGVTLSIARNGGANSQDVFGATGSLTSLTEGGNLVVGGSIIGTVTTNSNGTLLLTFNSNATNTLANSAIRQITYRNSSDAPPASVQLNWTLNDANTGTQGAGGALTATGTTTINITGVNDAPSGTDRTLTIDEDSTYTLTAADFGFSDTDGNSFARVWITSLPAQGELLFNGATFAVNNWVVKNDLDLGLLTFKPAANANGSSYASFTFQVEDNGGTANGGLDLDPSSNTITFNVNAVNDAPLLSDIETTMLAYSENDPAKAISSTLVLTDVDSTTINSATVQLSTGYILGEDKLSFTNTANITGSWDASTGTMTLTGVASVAEYQAALRAVAYEDLSQQASQGQLTVLFTVNNDITSNTVTRDVYITSVNDAPVVSSASLTLNEGQTVTLSAANFSVSDPDNLGFTYTVSNISGGYFQLSTATDTPVTSFTSDQLAASQVQFVHNGNEAAPSFSVTVSDGELSSNTLAATINYSAVNDAPVLSPYATVYNLTEDSAPVTVTVATVLGSSASDVDATAAIGLAITAINGSGGSIDYSLDGGNSWVSVGIVSETSALLLRSTDLLRLTPNGQNGGTVITTHRAWDQTSGVVGSKVDVSVNGGTTAYSAASDSVTITIASVNDAPVFSNLNGSPTFIENGSAVVLDADVTIFDVELSGTDNFNGSTLTLARHGGANSEDALAFDGITVTVSGPNVYVSGVQVGTYSFTGGQMDITFGANANNARVNTLMRNAVYWNWSDTPPASVQIDWTFSDVNAGAQGSGGALTATGSTTVNITGVNDAPVLSAVEGTTLAYAENASATAVTATLALTDADNANLTGATVQITGNYASGQDVLAFTDQNGITGSWDSSNGTLNLSGSATVAQYQTALRSVTYQNTSDAPSTASRTVSFSVTDGMTTSNVETRSLSIAAVNDAPTATITPASYSATEQTSLTLHGTGLSIADVDASSSSVQATLSVVSGTLAASAGTTGVTVSGSGTSSITLTGSLSQINDLLAGNASGSLSYIINSDTPPASDTLTLSVNDQGNTGSGGALTGFDVATINITAVNDAPVNTIYGDGTSVPEDSVIQMQGSVVIADADSGSGTVTTTLSVSAGAGVLSALSANGVTISGSGTNTLALSGDVASINAYFASAATAPVFTATADYNGAVSFTVVTTDNGNSGSGGALSDSDTISGSISAVADITNDSVTTNEDTPVTFEPLANDAFENSGRYISVIDGTSISSGQTVAITGGNVTLNANGTLTFTPTANSNGATSFSYTVTAGGATETATVSVTVNPVNDAPVLNLTDNAFTFVENASHVRIGSSATLTDVDSSDFAGGILTATISGNGTAEDRLFLVTQGTGAGQVQVVGSDVFIDGNLIATTAGGVGAGRPLVVSFTANADASAVQAVANRVSFRNVSDNPSGLQRTVEMVVADGDGGTSNTDSVLINVTPVNDAPIITASSLTLNEGQIVTLSAANFGVTDPDNTSFTYTVSTVSGGYLQLSTATGVAITSFSSAQLAGGQVQFVDDGNELAPSFDVTVSDGNLSSNTLSATINYTAVNDVPVISAANLTLNEGETVTLSAANFGVTDPDNASFTYTASSVSGGYFQLTSNPGVSVTNFSPAQLSTGQVQFVDDGNEVAPSFDVTVSDGSLSSNTLSATINYTGVNDAPVIGSASLTLNEGETVTLSAANFGVTDPDNASFTYTVSSVSGGYFQLTSTTGTPITSFTTAQLVAGQVQFVDDGNEVAPSFSVMVNDGTTDSNTVVASVSYTPVNDAPHVTWAGDYPFSTNEDVPSLGISVNTLITNGPIGSVGYSDVDGSSLKGMAVIAKTGNGTWEYSIDGVSWTDFGTVSNTQALLLDGNTQVRYVPNGTNEVAKLEICGWDQSTGTASTSGSASYGNASINDYDHAHSYEIATVTCTVLSVNDAPSGADTTVTTNEDTAYSFSRADFGFTDTDGNTFIGINITSLPGAGSLTLNGTAVTTGQIISTTDIDLGLLQFSPAVNANGSGHTSFAFQVQDDGGSLNGGVDLDPTANRITVNVTAVNDAPVLSGASLTLNEGDTVTLSLANFGVSDPDNASFTYTVSSVSGGYFQLSSAAGNSITQFTSADLNSGLVQFVDDGNEVAPSFSVAVSDGALTSNTLAATINYTAVNDNTPVISSGGSASVNENSPLSTVVYTATGSDADGNPLTWSLSGTDAALLNIDVNSGAVTLKAPADYESKTSYSFNVVASDGTFNSSQAVTLSVTNVNDNPVSAVSDSNAAANSVAENAANGTVVGITALATDADTGATISYSLTDNAGGRLAIDSNTGVVTVANGSLLDYESATSHSITVLATSSDSSTNSQSFTINVANLNDNPVSAVSDSNTTANSVAENAANGTVVGITALASDADTGATISYSLTDNASGRFAINSSTGVVTVADGSLLDYESATSHNITVLATSSDGSTNSQTFSIAVTNVNDNAPAITSGSSASVNENSPINTVVYTATGSDADGNPVTWSLSGTDAGLLSIDPNSGAVTLNASADYESKSSYSFNVLVSDGTLSSSQAVTLSVTNLNDNAPVLNSIRLTISEGQTITLDRASFDIADLDSNPLTYTLSGISGGYCQLTSAPGESITGFNDAELANGQVQFVHDGSETIPAFNLRVNDGFADSNTIAATFNYSPIEDPVISVMPDFSQNPVTNSLGVHELIQHEDSLVQAKTDLIEQSDDASVGDAKVIVDLNAYIENLIAENNMAYEGLAQGSGFYQANANNSSNQGSLANVDTNMAYEEKEYVKRRFLSVASSLSTIDFQTIDTENTLTETEEKEFWNNLDRISKHMDSPDVVEDAKPVDIKVVLGASVSLTAGFVSWILRAGSLMASFMSTVPLLRRFDPLPILRTAKKFEEPEETVLSDGDEDIESEKND